MKLCLVGLSASQPAKFFLTLNQHQLPVSSQLAVFFSYNKSAPATRHSQPNIAQNKAMFRLNVEAVVQYTNKGCEEGTSAR